MHPSSPFSSSLFPMTCIAFTLPKSFSASITVSMLCSTCKTIFTRNLHAKPELPHRVDHENFGSLVDAASRKCQICTSIYTKYSRQINWPMGTYGSKDKTTYRALIDPFQRPAIEIFLDSLDPPGQCRVSLTAVDGMTCK